MAEDIVVIGAGGFGRETLDVIEAINSASAQPVWRLVGVVDDDPAEMQVRRLQVRGVPVLGRLDALQTQAVACHYVVSIGAPAVRSRITRIMDGLGGRPATLIHPRAVVGTQAIVGQGTIVCAGALLSTNLRIGSHVHINPGAIIGHDTVLEDFVSVNPGAIVSGEVKVRTRTLVGAGATILQGRTIGGDSIVGAAACVTKDVADQTTVVGVPASSKQAR